MLRRDLFILLAAFGLSVLVRAPQLDRPLSGHHEYCTAITLITLQNWWVDGFAAHDGCPSGVFVDEARAFVPENLYDRNAQALALYYFSHPPLAFDLPYALFVLTNTAPNALGLELFNLFFHLITTLALYLTVRQVRTSGVAPLLAALLYLFQPGPLWFHSNAYMGDIFVQNTWAIHLLAAMVLFRSARPFHGLAPWSFAATLFLTVYTSWLGYFAGLAAVIWACWRWRQDRDARWARVLWITATAIVAATALTLWRYTRMVDLQALLGYFVSRYEVRGTTDLGPGLLRVLRDLVLVNYRMNYLPVLLLLIGLLLRGWLRKRPVFGVLDRPFTDFVALAGLPVLLDHAVLLPYAEHDFAALKGGLLLCGLAGIALSNIAIRQARVLAALGCLAGVLYFHRINPLPQLAGDRYTQERDLGQAIARVAKPDEVVFFDGPAPEPQVLWYAQRTVLAVDGPDEAREFLRKRGLQHGIVFRSSPQGLQHERIDANAP